MGYSVAAVVFNMLLTFVFGCSTVCAFLMYRTKKLPGFLALIAIFVSYVIDNAIVFCTEIIPPFADIYDRLFLETPSIKTVCFIIRISSMLYLLNRVIPAFSLNAVLSFTALHAFALICAPLISEPDWMVYCYYFFSQFIIITVCLWGLHYLKRADKDATVLNAVALERVLLYFLVMTSLVLIEDTYVIFFVDVYTNTGLNIFNRNFSENFLFIGFAVRIIVYTIRHIDELVSFAQTETATECEVVEKNIDYIHRFASDFNLTDRELEILRCVLDGKSQQEISQLLVIALGTVKTHTHNIYAKVGAGNRNQMLAKYREFLAEAEQESG